MGSFNALFDLHSDFCGWTYELSSMIFSVRLISYLEDLAFVEAQ